ncbi:hypothetical protein ACFQZS_00100 [Mucilaginibacter calamicampi]|uniref:Uncharacterized protein n=1 Tax=Mucilaginibacter calamicampi TaxID=1302352 RepID=A0ABW2YR10_9SPHI
MRILALMFLLAICLHAHAQKLPNVQQVSLRAPANIKVDGKPTEWGDIPQAYNNGTEVYYTIANNHDFLYLTVKATDAQIIKKIIVGGLAFTINKSGNKKDKNGAVITFPFYEKGKNYPFVTLETATEIKRDAANYASRWDSLINTSNNKIKAGFKFIGTSGLKDIAEDMISVYNTEGISAAAMLDDKLVYNFELAVPLKLLGGGTTLKTLAYNIKLNGHAFGGSDLKDSGRFVIWVGRDGQNYRMEDSSPRSWSLASSTDFWGEYTLAK